MKGFWTCGPFKEVEDRLEKSMWKLEQTALFLDIIKEYKEIEEQLDKGTVEEKLLAGLMKIENEKRLNLILGITEDGNKEKNDEVSGEAILESILERAESQDD